jgi:hypothetical protein
LAQLKKMNADLDQQASSLVSKQADAIAELGEEKGRQALSNLKNRCPDWPWQTTLRLWGRSRVAQPAAHLSGTGHRITFDDLEAELERRWLVEQANTSRLKKGR